MRVVKWEKRVDIEGLSEIEIVAQGQGRAVGGRTNPEGKSKQEEKE